MQSRLWGQGDAPVPQIPSTHTTQKPFSPSVSHGCCFTARSCPHQTVSHTSNPQTVSIKYQSTSSVWFHCRSAATAPPRPPCAQPTLCWFADAFLPVAFWHLSRRPLDAHAIPLRAHRSARSSHTFPMAVSCHCRLLAADTCTSWLLRPTRANIPVFPRPFSLEPPRARPQTCHRCVRIHEGFPTVCRTPAPCPCAPLPALVRWQMFPLLPRPGLYLATRRRGGGSVGSSVYSRVDLVELCDLGSIHALHCAADTLSSTLPPSHACFLFCSLPLSVL